MYVCLSVLAKDEKKQAQMQHKLRHLNNITTISSSKGRKLHSVNASLITGLPESPNRPIGLFGVLAIVTKVGFLVSRSPCVCYANHTNPFGVN